MRYTTAYLDYLDNQTEKPGFIMQAHGKPSIRTGSYQPCQVQIHDARESKEMFTLDRHGFYLVTRPTPAIDFDDEQAIVEHYYADIIELIKAETGAKRVDIIDHTIRSSEPTAGLRGIATHVHNDYTDKSCPQKLRAHLGDEMANELLRRRVEQINAWRPLNGPVRVAPLAIVDGGSVSPEDLIPCDIVYPDRTGEIYAVRFNPEHRWYYFADMTPDEIILFKGYDSELDGRIRFTPHTAFHHPQSRIDAPARVSIEVRTIASF